MADNANITHHLNGLFTLKNGREHQLMFSAYRGNLTITVFKGNAGGRPPVRTPISRDMQLKLADQLEKLLNGNPDRFTMSRSSKDNNGTTVLGETYAFIKDERRCYSIELVCKALDAGEVVKFNLRSAGTLCFGNQQATDEQRSESKLRELIHFLRYDVVTYLAESRWYAVDENSYGGKQGGFNKGNGYNRRNNFGNNGGGQVDPFAGEGEQVYGS